VACPRAVSGKPCYYHEEGKCFYSHDDKKITKAKSALVKPKGKGAGGKGAGGKSSGKGEKDKSKIQCIFHKKGTCKGGEKCSYSHEGKADEPNATAMPAVVNTMSNPTLIAIGEKDGSRMETCTRRNPCAITVGETTDGSCTETCTHQEKKDCRRNRNKVNLMKV